MNTFNFFFGLNLGQRLFSHTDNLSKTLQQTRISAVSGKRVAGITKEVLQKMRDNISFKSFYDTVLLKSKNYPSVTEPMLPRRTRALRRIEIGTGEQAYPATAQNYYRRIYFEAIDLMVNAIVQRFDQPSIETYANMESLLVKTLKAQDNSTKLQFLENVYGDDVDIVMLTGQMEILKVLLKDGDFLCFDDIILKIKELLTPERNMISEIITICKLILVNLATSAAGDRLFSTARRLTTWLRSSMTKERFCNLTILNSPAKTEPVDFLFLILQTNLKNGTVTENEILVCLENPMYSNTTYYFTALL